MRRFCRRCQVEYDEEDNYGTHRCRTHKGKLRRDEKGRIFFTCCPQQRRHRSYRPRDMSFGFSPKAIQLPPGCTPCDHGQVYDQRCPNDITVQDYWDVIANIEATRLGRELTDAEKTAVTTRVSQHIMKLEQLGRIRGDVHELTSYIQRS